MESKDKIKIIGIETSSKISMMETFKDIKYYNEKFQFNKILIDSGGLGQAMADILINELGKFKIVELNNRSRSVLDEDMKGKILKEDLYSNLLELMEFKKIEMIKDERLLKSLKNISFEYKDDKVKISGKNDHVAEACIRAVWGMKEKGLKLFLS